MCVVLLEIIWYKAARSVPGVPAQALQNVE